MPVKVQLLELDTGQNLERISQSYILLPCLFNFLQGTSWKNKILDEAQHQKKNVCGR